MTHAMLLLKITVLLAAGLAAVHCLARANPRWRMFACETAALAILLLPAATALPWSMSFHLNPARQSHVESLPLPAQSLVPAAGRGAHSVGPAQAAAAPAGQPAPGSTGPAIPWWALLHAAGLLALVIRCALGMAATRRLQQRTDHPDAALADRFKTLAREFDLRPLPRLRLDSDQRSPFCCGLRRSAVVIPRALTEPGRESELTMVLRHELHHLANRDLWRVAAMALLSWALWFHPLAWWLRRRHNAAMEELADRIAASSETDSGAYRRMLAALALRLQARPAAPVALGMFHGSRTLTRLRRLASPAPHRRLKRTALALALLAAAPLPLLLAAVEVDARNAEAEAWRRGIPAEQRAQAEQRIKQALAYLADRQREDGGLPARSGGDGDVAATSFAGMTFFVYGGLDGRSPLHAPMTRCLDYVLSCQSEHGWFHRDPGERKQVARELTYHHAVATWFLASLLPHLEGGRKAAVQAALPAAAKRLVDAQKVPKQAPRRGGWRYTPFAEDSDISCTGWAVEALAAARDAGVEIPASVFGDAATYAAGLRLEQGGFGYTSPTGPGTAPQLAKALRCLHRNNPNDWEGMEREIQALDRKTREGGNWAVYGAFWTAMTLRDHDDDAARAFTEWLVPHYNGLQKNGGWSSPAGDVVATAWIALAYGPGADRPMRRTPDALAAEVEREVIPIKEPPNRRPPR